MDDEGVAILRMVLKAKTDIVKATGNRLAELEKDILNEMGISVDEAREEWKKRYGFPKPKGDD